MTSHGGDLSKAQLFGYKYILQSQKLSTTRIRCSFEFQLHVSQSHLVQFIKGPFGGCASKISSHLELKATFMKFLSQLQKIESENESDNNLIIRRLYQIAWTESRLN